MNLYKGMNPEPLNLCDKHTNKVKDVVCIRCRQLFCSKCSKEIHKSIKSSLKPY